jgi:hypothetical protein
VAGRGWAANSYKESRKAMPNAKDLGPSPQKNKVELPLESEGGNLPKSPGTLLIAPFWQVNRNNASRNLVNGLLPRVGSAREELPSIRSET